LRSVFYKNPLIIVCSALIGGLLYGNKNIAEASAFFVVTIIGSLFLLKRNKWSLFLPIFFFVLGIFHSMKINKPNLPPNHIANLPIVKVEELEGKLIKAADVKTHSTSFIIHAERAFLDDWVKTQGLVRLYLSRPLYLEKGTLVRAKVKLRNLRDFYNPGSSRFNDYQRRRGIFLTGYVIGEVKVLKEGRSFWSIFRKNFREALRRSSTPRSEGILMALALGQRGKISSKDQDIFRNTGTAHLLAISGLHMTLVSGFLIFLIKRLREKGFLIIGENYQILLALPFVLGYLLVSQSPVSALRAGLSIITLGFLLWLGKPKNPFNILCLCAIIILSFMPYEVWDPSFQLSFVATGGILIFAKKLISLFRSKRLINYLWGTFALSIIAQIATLPILLHHFHLISIIGPLANLIAIPVVGLIILPFTLISLILSTLHPALASPTIGIASLFTELLLWVLENLEKLPFSHIWFLNFTFFEALLIYASLGFVLVCRNIPKKTLFVSFLLLLLGIFTDVIWRYEKIKPSGKLEVNFLDVGQGDSAFLRLPSGKKILIDGGGAWIGDFDVGKSIIAPFLWEKGFLKVDYLILSHPQPDHYKGLIFIAKHFHPKEFWYGPGELPEELEAVFKELKEKGVIIRELHKGIDLAIDGVNLKVLHPPLDFISKDMNDQSLVLKIQWNNRSVLFTGDITENAEIELSREDSDLKSEVLKVPHHGSKRSSSYPFAIAVSPKFAIISVGRNNPYGHPHQKVVSRYEGLGATVLRTDLCGMIQMEGSSLGWDVKTYLKCASYPLLR